MEFDNAFEVPLPVEDAWKVLMDIRRIAPCMPGAELTDVIDDRTYKGKIGVRLGPVALTFAGTVKFEEIDDANHTARVVAQGTDAKGRGAANAVASFRLEPGSGGTAEIGTNVLVHTNLTLSGAVAQYGRGVGIIQMTAAAIITQFANNLKAQLGPGWGSASPRPRRRQPGKPGFLRPCGAIRRALRRARPSWRAATSRNRRRPRAQWLPSRQPLPRPHRLRLSRFPASPCSAPSPGSGSNGSFGRG